MGTIITFKRPDGKEASGYLSNAARGFFRGDFELAYATFLIRHPRGVLLVDAAFGDTVFNAVLANVNGSRSGFKSTDGETGDYSSVWTVERDWDNRTSLITDPSDGRRRRGARRSP